MEYPAVWWDRCFVKNLRITVHEEMSVPEEWKITTPSNQSAPCIQAENTIWKPAVVWLRFQPDEELLGEEAEPGSGYWIQDEQGPSGTRELKSGHNVEWA
jgi:hypothetical protein